MCNLYSMTATVDEMRRVFGPFEGETSNHPPFDNIYPGYQAPVLRRSEKARLKLEMMTWGLPGPAADGSQPVTNVRNLESPFWRSSLHNPRWRCLIPVTRFCEWTAEPDQVTGRKSKVWFAQPDQPVFAFAGVWRPADSGSLMAFLTCEPNRVVGAVHPNAMPVILDPSSFGVWLDSERVDACALARPFPDERMVQFAT
ncbi:SOS response-associated peptidase family protein [Sphingomonas sp.]|uniref:SOS response-associated peptidase n=1 Tax=Sphingomonas sp. TaxID=28214 RepID=UPI00182F0252|nr:SOS response-associated peptidase family protein [Sphingomonas sp.]MBA3510800.1 SOS response-associated peptidase family protein [Sphingomonas sp.]